MRDGKLKLTVEAGEIVAVSVDAGLDLAYRRLFDSARKELQRPEPPIEAGIQLIVFGCFWLEAVCNEAVRVLLRASTKPTAAADSAWQTIKRASFDSKLSIVSAFRKTPDRDPAARGGTAACAPRGSLPSLRRVSSPPPPLCPPPLP